MAEITVDVGVRLQAMQSSVAELQRVLDKLKPNTGGFKDLQKIISNITNNMDKLRLQTGKPFGSQGQFNQTEKTVEKLEESLGRAKLAIERIKFSDLKLDQGQIAQLDGFNDQLKKIKQEFATFKDDLKNQFLSNDFNKQFVEGINPNLLNKSFDEIIKSVQSKTDALGRTLANATAELAEFQKAADIGAKIDQASQNGFISEQGLGKDVFDKFFQTNSKGVFSFKTGGGLKKGEIQQQFFDYLKTEFQLTPAQIDELTGLSAKDIRAKLAQTDFFDPQRTAADKANKKLPQAGLDFTAASQNYENAVAVMTRLTPLLDALSNKDLDLADKQKLVNQAIADFQQKCEGSIRGATATQNAFDGLNSQLESFKQQLSQVNAQWLKLQNQQATFNSMKMAITNFMGFNQVLNLTKRAVNDAMNHIKQLDATMNGISIVTDMSTADLWKQVDAYSALAQKFGTTIQGAYDISKIYYQQGLETSDVMVLTEETLKLSKVSGLDYAKSTDYMTTALRGFKMEMQEASTVVDVYSNLAANTAVSQEELAVAMSKTASSMESVGSTFQDTSAMIATMVAVTRESATNIGSAMKSIASRYGELTKDPQKLIDSEGEAMSFNKVDAALQSVGISMQTVDHQFRDFTDVIVELSEKWDTLDSTQQRYIATQFAGNRQQSRFLALVSNGDLLKENMETAANSEDVGTIQALKAMDSIESKMNQVQVAAQQFYTTLGAEGVWKSALDGINNFITSLNGLPKLFGKIPVGAITVIIDMVSTIKNALFTGLTEIAAIWQKGVSDAANKVNEGEYQAAGERAIGAFKAGIDSRKNEVQQAIKDATSIKTEKKAAIKEGEAQISRADAYKQSISGLEIDRIGGRGIVDVFTDEAFNIDELIAKMLQFKDITTEQAEELRKLFSTPGSEQDVINALNEICNKIRQTGENSIEAANKINTHAGALKNLISSSKHLVSDMNNFASALNMIGNLINGTSRSSQKAAGAIMMLSGTIRAASIAIKAFQAAQNHAAFSMPWTAAAMAAMAIINGLSTIIETSAEKTERLKKEAEELNNQAKEAKANYNVLNRSIDKLNELKETRYDSAEAAEEYQTAVDELANKYPELIAGLDEAGNVIIDNVTAEAALAEARKKTKEATLEAAKKEYERTQHDQEEAEKKLKKARKNVTGAQTYSPNNFNAYFKMAIDNMLSSLGGIEQIKNDFASQSQPIENYIEELISSEELFGYDSNIKEELKNYLKSQLSDDWVSQFLAFNPETDSKEKAQELLDAYAQLDETLKKDYEGYAEVLRELIQATGNATDYTNLNDSAKKQLLSAQAAYNESYEALQDGQKVLINYLFDSSEIITKKGIDESTFTEIETDYYKALEKADINLTTENDKYKKYIDMMKNLNQYSLKDWQTFFGDGFEDNEAYQAIEGYYNNVYHFADDLRKKILDSFGNNREGRDFTQGQSFKFNADNVIKISDLYNAISTTKDNISADLFNWLTAQIDLIKSLGEKGFITSGNAIASQITNILNALNNNMDEGEASIVGNLLKQYSLNTIEGIANLRDALKDAGVGEKIDDYLQTIQDSLIYNLPLAIQSYTAEIVENVDSIADKMKKTSSGFDAKEALEALDLINKESEEQYTLADFSQTKSGKFAMKDPELRKKYFDALIEEQNNINETLQERLDQVRDKTQREDFEGKLKNVSEDNPLLNIEEIGDFSFILQDMGFAKDLGNGNLELTELYWEKIKEQGFDLLTTIDEYLAKQLSTSEIAMSYLKKELPAETALENSEYVGALRSLSGYGLSNKSKALDFLAGANGEKIYGIDYEKYKPVQDAMNSAYNSFFSDLFTKGAENLHFEDYQLDIDQGTWNQMLSMSYEEIVATYGNRASMLIEEQNALMVQAIEKDTQKTQGAEDALKNVNFLKSDLAYASMDTLQSLADSLHVAVETLFNPADYDAALGGYKVDMAALAANGLSEIVNSSNIVADSVKAFLDSISEGIGKGLEGKLGFAERDNLISNLGKYGMELDAADFTRTADGLKLSEQKAIELYNTLKQIDSISAQITFDALAKSLEDNNENYTNISTIAKRIADLQREIDNPDVSTARRQEYEAELAVAEEIYRVRSSTDNKDFDFMSRNLPNGMQNPIDYWDATGEAYKAMNQAAKSGYMEIQDFYNIVNEMNNMAAVSGQTLSFMGQTLSGKAEDAAALIEAGMSALKNVDGKGVKIALGKLGTDFSTGAANMSGDFDTGVKAMAKSQIKMLDAAIRMLEAMVAMENIDTTGDGIFDLGEIFANGVDSSGGFTQPVMDWLRQIDIATGGIQVGAQSLQQALLELGKVNPDSVVTIMNQLKNIDWTLGDVNTFAQIQNVLSTFFPGIQISQMGPSVFDLLDIPSDANEKTVQFQDFIKKTGLGVKEAQGVIQAIQNGILKPMSGKYGEHLGAKKGSDVYSAIESMLGLDKKGKKTFESFAGDYLTEDELQIWSKINIDYKKNGSIGSAIYTASDGSTHILDPKNITEWQSEIEKIEDTIFKQQQTGRQDVANVEDSEPVTLESGSTVKGLIEAKDGGVDAWYNGTYLGNFSDKATANAAIEAEALKRDKEARGIGNKTVITPEGTIETRADFTRKAQLSAEETQENKDFEKAVGQVYKEDADKINSLFQKGGQWEDYLKTSENGERTLELPGFESIKLADDQNPADLIKQLGEDLFSSPDQFAEIPQKIAEGIQQAFQGDAGSQIGTAISEGIKTAFGANTEVGADGIPIDNINVKPTKITIDATESAVEGLDKIQELLDGSTNENGEVVPLTKNITVTLNNGEAVSLNVTGVNTETDIWTITGIDAAGNIITLEGTEIAGLTLSGSQWTLNTIFGNGLGIELGNAKITGLTPNGTGWTINAVTSNGTPISFETPTITGLTYSSGWKIDAVTSSGEQLDLGDANITGLTPSENGWIVDTVTSGGEKISYTDVQISGLTPSGSQWTINSVFGNGAAIDLGKATVTGIQNNNDGTWTITTVNGSITLDLDSINGLNNGEGESGYSLGNIVSGILNLSAQTKAAEDEIETFRQNQESTPLKLSYIFAPQNENKGFNDTYLSNSRAKATTIARNWEGSNKKKGDRKSAINDIKDNEAAIVDYVQQVQAAVNAGESLSDIDYNNILSLKEILGENTSGGFLDQFSTTADKILSLSDANKSDSLTGLKELAQSFSGLEVGELPQVAIALGNIASAAERLKGIPWDTIAEGIKKVAAANSGTGEPTTNSGSGGNTGGTGGVGGLQSVQLDVKAEKVDAAGASITTQGGSVTIEGTPTISTNAAVNVAGSSVTITGAPQNNDNPQPKPKNNTGDGATQSQAQPQSVGVNLDISEFTNSISTVQSAISSLDVSNAETAASKFNTAMTNTMNSVPDKKTVKVDFDLPKNQQMNVTASVNVKVNVSGGTPTGIPPVTGVGAPNTPKSLPVKIKSSAKATGNVALAKGSNTLIGELGPELVVANGRYFVAGENGAEFIDLPDNAIVFNHLQTKSLLGSGKATGGKRGKPIKSEKASVSFATGNVSGPALASAAAALAALKQIRAMWQSMLDASAKDLGSQAGRGGGGGGGGGGGDDAEQPTTTTDDIQRWYNWLRQIDKIEQDISYQEKLQTKYENDRIANGQKIYKTQKQQYDLLGEEIKRNEKLAALQKSWYDNKRAELAASSYGKIFTYDENGLQQYTGNDRPGSGVGLDILENLTRRNVNGQAIDNAATAKKQLAYLQSVGFNLSDLLYNDDGTKVAKSIDKNLKLKKINKKDKDNDLYTQMMENFWNNVDAWRDELDSLYDSYHEQQEKIIENQNKQNEILQAFVENELDVEQQLLEAIESREQALIDKLQDQKEALEKSNDKFIKGLTDQLNKEKEMRQNNERDSDLVKLQRQLAILQRSGGSASQIKSLQDQIASQQQDMYYEERQQQIDAIQEASDKQLERLDTQISIMTETLDYQKENGLLWNEVRDIMETNTPEEAAQKILDWNNDYASKSALDVQESIREFQEAFQQWTERRDDENDPLQDTSISRSDAIEDIEAGNKEFSALSGESKSKIQSAARNAGQKAYDEAIANGGTEEEAEKAYRQAYSNTISDSDTLQKYKNIESHGADAEEAYNDFVTDAKKQQSFINTSLYKQNESDIKEKFIEKFVNEAQYDDEGNIINRTEASRSAMAAALNDVSADNKLTNEDTIVALTSSVQSYKTPSKKKKLQKSMVYAAGSEIKFKDGKPVSYKYKNNKGRVVSANFLQTTDGNWVLASLFPEVVDAYNRNSMVTAAANYINDAALSNFSADAHENETVEVASLYSSIGGTQYGVVEENGKITNRAIGRGPISISGVKGYVPKETSINETKTPRFASIQVNAIDGKLINGGPISFTPQNLGWKKGIKAAQLKKTNYWAVINALKNKNDLARILAYKQGGMADFTGPAWLDGTKTKPEAVLNAAQTDFLKHDLLGNKRNSLASIVTQLQDIFDNTIAGTTSSTSSDESVTIENVSINFNAGTISSDYDARRAGELVKEEMLKIARKTGNRSVSRR